MISAIKIIKKCKTKNKPNQIIKFLKTLDNNTQLGVCVYLHEINSWKQTVKICDSLSKIKLKNHIIKMNRTKNVMWITKNKNSKTITNIRPKKLSNLVFWNF